MKKTLYCSSLRKLLGWVNLPKVYEYLSNKNEVEIEDTQYYFNPIITNLIQKPYNKTENRIIVNLEKFPTFSTKEDKLHVDPHIEVNLLNPNYETEPPTDLKIWGGDEKNKLDCPEGYYNANWSGYYEVLAMDFTPWDELIDSKVFIESNLYDKQPEFILAEILWEMTFYGDEESQKEKREELIKVLDDCKDEKD